MIRSFRVLVLAVFCLGLVMPTIAVAADCQGLLKKAKKEFNIIRRQQMLEQTLAECPSDPAVNYEYGYSFERLRKYARALSYYRKTLSLRPGMARAWFGIGDIERSKGKLKAAREAYEKGIKFDYKNTRVMAKLNEVRKRLGLGVYKLTAGKGAGSRPASAKVAASAAAPPLLKAITRVRIRFAANSAALDLDARDVLSVLVGQAMLNRELADVGLKVVGIARDSRLARKRAETVRNFLLSNFAIGSKRLLAGARLLVSGDNGSGVEFVRQ